MRYDDNTPKDNEEHVPFSLIVGGLGLAAALVVGALVVMGRGEDEEPVAQAEAPLPASPVAEASLSEEIAEEPEPEPLSPAEQLREAQAEVESLQTELSARNAELAELTDQMERHEANDKEAAARARERQAAIQHQIDGLRAALQTARDERDALRTELSQALVELDRQVKRNDKLMTTAVAFKTANTENLWRAFTNNAKVRICDRGTWRRRQDCEADLDAWFDDEQHAAFTECVSTFQTVPMLWEADSEEVPAHASLIDARDRERGDDWYVIYCDPTLPEGGVPRDITEQGAPLFAMADD